MNNRWVGPPLPGGGHSNLRSPPRQKCGTQFGRNPFPRHSVYQKTSSVMSKIAQKMHEQKNRSREEKERERVVVTSKTWLYVFQIINNLVEEIFLKTQTLSKTSGKWRFRSNFMAVLRFLFFTGFLVHEDCRQVSWGSCWLGWGGMLLVVLMSAGDTRLSSTSWAACCALILQALAGSSGWGYSLGCSLGCPVGEFMLVTPAWPTQRVTLVACWRLLTASSRAVSSATLFVVRPNEKEC